MRSLAITAISVLCLMLASYAGIHGTAFAEDTQKNETDVEFAKRMTSKIKGLQWRIEQLQDAVDEAMTNLPASHYGNAGAGDIRNRRNTTGGSFSASPHARMRAKLNSLEKKAEKERVRLQAPQGYEGSKKPLNRESINKNVKRIERDVDNVQRELYGR